LGPISFSKGSSVENGVVDGRAVAYLRTSSAANLGGDSEPRQREAIQSYAARAGLEVVDLPWLYQLS
jgi:hypothetical protein